MNFKLLNREVIFEADGSKKIDWQSKKKSEEEALFND